MEPSGPDNPEASVDGQAAMLPGMVSGNGPSPLSGSRSFPPDWCGLISVDGELNRIISVAGGYVVDVTDDCATAGLTQSFSLAQRMDWVAYLVDYTYLIAGCPLDEQPDDSGLSVFGPANTAVVGVERGPLGFDDIDRLTAMYVRRYGDAANLAGDQRQLLADYLLTTASSDIDPNASNSLSICPDEGGP